MSENIKESIEYELEEKFQYAFKGDMQEAQFITLMAPTSKTISTCADLKQSFFRAMPQGESNEKHEKEGSLDDLDGPDIMTMISMSKDVDLKNVLVYGRDVFSSGIALVDGETKVTKPILDLICQDDLEAMIGEYFVNFILASWLKKMKKTLSEQS